MRFLLFILLLCSFGVQAGSPVISCTPSRTSGTAPLGVTFDCTATTDADTTKPFIDLLYSWSFGDTSSGKWSTGANTNLSKNGAFGAVAGHVYETAGTYTWKIQVSDGTTTKTSSGTITVASPDTTFATTATVCFFNSAVGTGCPSGATETASSDFDAAIISCMGTTKRCLFKRGDTFASSTTGTVASAGPNTIGAYGSGALPIITSTNIAGVLNINNAAVDDLRVMDLDIRGNGATDTGNGIVYAANVANVTILRVTILDIGKGITGSGTAVCAGCVFQENTVYNTYAASGGNAFLGRLLTSAMLGNDMGPSYGEHVCRVQRAQKTAISNNNCIGPLATKTALVVRADVHSTALEDSFYFIVSDNKIGADERSIGPFSIEPDNGTSDARFYDYIVERNWVYVGAYTGGSTVVAMRVTGTDGVVRNNLVNLSGPTVGERDGIIVSRTGASDPDPLRIQVLNNTCFASDTGVTKCVVIGASSTDAVVKNNLSWFDIATGTSVQDGGVTTTGAQGTFGNSSNAQSTGTDPLFDGPTTSPKGFRIGTGSYAATGGTALFPSSKRDFFNCDDITANEHMGAFVSRRRARCYGVAGP